jgi:hypothetical protein
LRQASDITIPATVTEIKNLAFYCVGLASLTCRAVTPPTLGDPMFQSTQFVIKVPSASVAAYKAASGWSAYADKITAMP